MKDKKMRDRISQSLARTGTICCGAGYRGPYVYGVPSRDDEGILGTNVSCRVLLARELYR